MTTHIDYFQYLIFCHSSVIHACFGRHTCTWFWSSYMHVPLRNMFFSPSECTCAIHPSCALCGTNALLHCCILRVLLRHACVMRHLGPSPSPSKNTSSNTTRPTNLQPALRKATSPPHPPHLGAIQCCNYSSQECVFDFIKIFTFKLLSAPCAQLT